MSEENINEVVISSYLGMGRGITENFYFVHCVL